MKKISLLLVVMLIFSVMPLSVFADSAAYAEADLLAGRSLLSNTTGQTVQGNETQNISNSAAKWTELLSGGAMKFSFSLDTEDAQLLVQARENGVANQFVFTASADRLLINSANNPSQAPFYETVNVTHTIGTKYIYIVIGDADGYSIYRKTEADASYTKLGSYLYNTAVGQELTTRYRVTTGTATMNYVLIASALNPIMTDEAAILTDGSQLAFADDFSAGTSAFNTGACEIAGGVMTPKANAYKPGFGNLGDFGITGSTPFAIKFRCKIDSASVATSIVQIVLDNKKRIYYFISKTGDAYLYDKGVKLSAVTEPNQWYEYIFAYDGVNTVTVYRRADGEAFWSTLGSSEMADKGADQMTFFGANANSHFDYIEIYKGAGVKLNAPEVSGSSLKVSGRIAYGTPASEYNRRAAVLAAAYNAEYGYTERVWKTDVTALAGETTDISQSFDLGTASNHVTAMVWDSIDTLLPLTAATGYSVANHAAAASTDEVSCAVHYNEVNLKGYTGVPNGDVTATLSDSAGEVKAIMQTAADKNGMIDSTIAVDPTACKTGVYTLKAVYNNAPKLNQEVQLVVDGYADIGTAEEFLTYINANESDDVKAAVAIDADAAFKRFNEVKGNVTSLYAFREAVEKTAADLTGVIVRPAQLVENKPTVVINNYSGEEKECAVILGVFKDGRLVQSYVKETVSLAGRKQTAVPFDEANVNESHSYKIFVYDNLSNIKPFEIIK